MHPDTTPPRIYVASLSDYNAGHLHGVWIDATQDLEVIVAEVDTMLARSSEPVAEEYAIHDYEGFGSAYLSEYETLEDVAAIAAGIAQHGLAFAHWANHLGTSEREDLDTFEDCYRGHWESFAAYGDDLIETFGADLDELVPEYLRPYVRVDTEAFARDMATMCHIVEAPDGIYVFEQ